MRQHSYSRRLTATLLMVLCAPIVAILCSVGYVAAIAAFEAVFVPPLRSLQNYGQFGFLVIYFGISGLLFGASFGLLPYTRFARWLPAFAMIAVITFLGESDLANHFDATDVAGFAMITVGVLIVVMAWLVSFVVVTLEERAKQSAKCD